MSFIKELKKKYKQGVINEPNELAAIKRMRFYDQIGYGERSMSSFSHGRSICDDRCFDYTFHIPIPKNAWREEALKERALREREALKEQDALHATMTDDETTCFCNI